MDHVFRGWVATSVFIGVHPWLRFWLSAFTLSALTAPVTVLEAIQKTADFLAPKGVDSPRLQAELLLAHVLQLPRMKLYLNFDRALAPAEVDAFRELVRRRAQREPLQHLLGSVSFCGLDFTSNRHALIPRPETETLAQLAWEFLQAHASAEPAMLDFGTGTGCIAVTVAVKCPRAQVWAVDISAPALTLARENAARHNVGERVRFFAGDGFAALPAGMQFDLIVSNPPYIAGAEIATLEPEVRDHDPRLALDGGADGLDFYRRLAEQGGGWLRSGGQIMLEFGDGQTPAIEKIFTEQNWVVEAVRQDYSQRDRFLLAKRP
ncbi:MAG: peptide chain release factor N(5)-glutamine methyltransferase [Verrucomicrobiota bacterium]|jgi:release factor glutamine methyltransferase